MEKAEKLLLERGIVPGQIHTKIIEGGRSPAADLLKAARKGESAPLSWGKRVTRR
jgi:hypothetical protein